MKRVKFILKTITSTMLIAILIINTSAISINNNKLIKQNTKAETIVLNEQITDEIAQKYRETNYKNIGRYLNNDNNSLTLEEYRVISNNDLNVIPIYKIPNLDKNADLKQKGKEDAKVLFRLAKEIYIGQNAIIFLEIKNQESNKVLNNYIDGVLEELKASFHNEYKVGLYSTQEIIDSIDNNLKIKDNIIFKNNDEDYDFKEIKEDEIKLSSKDKLAVSLDTRYDYYDRDKAMEYADKWYKRFNTNENYHYSADCANFTSQALYAGGIDMTSAWYSYKSNNKKETKLNNINKNSKFDIGEPWRLAREQYKYFKNPENGYINGDVITIKSKDEIKDIIKRCEEESNPIQKGDLMFFSNDNETAHHATLIHDVNENGIYFSSHSEPFINKNLVDAMEDSSGETFFIVRIKDKNN